MRKRDLELQVTSLEDELDLVMDDFDVLMKICDRQREALHRHEAREAARYEMARLDWSW